MWYIMIKNLLALKKYYNKRYLSILCYCKYSMKEYTTKIPFYVNMYCIIFNLYEEINYIKTKIITTFLHFALISIKQLSIQDKYTLN